MNKGIKRTITVLFASLFISVFGILPVCAGSGGGTGSGTGGNGDVALTVVSSSIKDGDSNVPLNPTIDLQFNKNVVNLTVKENNSRCFHLISSEGNSVKIKIIFPDDQLKSNYKEHIFIVPEQNLAPNSKYTLTVDKTLQSKSANALGNPYSITFTTGTAAATSDNASLKDLADDVQVFTNALPLTADSNLTGSTSGATASKTPFSSIDNNRLSWIIIGTIVAVIVIFVVILLISKRNRHSNQT